MIRRLRNTQQSICAVLLERLGEPDCVGLVKPTFNAEEWLADPANILIADGKDMVMLEGDGDGVYSLHWLLASRGRNALVTAERLLRRAFHDHRANVLYGLTPVHLRAARWFNRSIGATSQGIVETEFGPQEWFLMSRQEFEARYGLFDRQASEK